MDLCINEDTKDDEERKRDCGYPLKRQLVASHHASHSEGLTWTSKGQNARLAPKVSTLLGHVYSTEISLEK